MLGEAKSASKASQEEKNALSYAVDVHVAKLTLQVEAPALRDRKHV
jgi:hypothetical protein